MARPLKEGMDYFPHDVDASDDEKIDALRAVHGNDGYALYFIALERIYRTAKGELDLSKPAFRAALVKKIGVNQERFDEILETALDIGCFCRQIYQDRKVLTSKGVLRRFSEVQSLREKWRARHSPDVFPGDNEGDNPPDNEVDNMETTLKEKKRKEKKSMYGEFVFLTDLEYQSLVVKYGQQMAVEMIAILNDAIGAKGYKYKSHYYCMKDNGWVCHEYKDRHKHDTTMATSSCKHDTTMTTSSRKMDITDDLIALQQQKERMREHEASKAAR